MCIRDSQPSGDGVEMGTGTTGTYGDGDQFLSPCSSLVPGCQSNLTKMILNFEAKAKALTLG